MLTLIKNGFPCAQIVVTTEPLPVERFAAVELQKYLRQMTDVDLPISDRPIDDRPAIRIGTAAHRDTLDLSENTLGFDGFVVRTEDGDLLLAGHKSYSCLYAVYHLLERYLGCGFFEDGDQVPTCDTVSIPAINDVETPRFAWRGHNHCMQDAYAGQRWWDKAQLSVWVEFLAKKRCNSWMVERMAEYCGITAHAAAKLGIDIPLQPWQEARTVVLRAVYARARMLGVRITYYTGLCCENGIGEAGTYCYADGPQLREFVRQWNATHEEQIPTFEYQWCGCVSHVLDPRSPVVRRFLAACVEAYAEILGTDHLYQLWLPSEGFWSSADHEEMNRLTYAMAGHVIDAIKLGDPQAFIFSPPPFPYAATFEAQQRAVRDAGLMVAGDQWLNAPGRMHDFLMCDYYWGLPWSTGMSVQCGKATNPSADLELCLRNARELAAAPRAAQCIGFNVRTEMSHKMILAMDFFFALAWDPAAVDLDDYLHRWTLRRYGLAGERLHRSTELLANSVYSSANADLYNGPLYRHLRGTYLPGLTPASVKRTLSYLPALREVVELLLFEYKILQDSPLYLTLFRDGVRGLRARIQAGLATADTDDARHFFTACDLALDGFSTYMRRTAQACGDLGNAEIADICAWVATEPPRTFRDAIQLMYFAIIGLWFGEDHGLTTPGRMDQTLWPYYAADIAAGRLTPQQALELICALYIQLNRILWPGSAISVIVGGRDADGKNVTNDLTYLCLETRRQTHLVYPTVGLAWHDDTPAELTEYACRLLATGIGDPAFFNDELIAHGLRDHDVSVPDSFNYMNSTCVEIKVCGCSNMYVTSPYLNCPQALLDVMAAVANGEDAEPDGYEALFARVRDRLAAMVRDAAATQEQIWQGRVAHGGFPLASCVIHDCLARGQDFDRGGARYHWVENSFVGLANLADSLVAVRELVYTTRELTLADFYLILQIDFAGHDALLQRVRARLPHYGNDDPRADAVAAECAAFLIAATEANQVGGHRYVPGFFCWIMHGILGEQTIATPDGRLAKQPLADGAGAAQGREHAGPTASVLSTTCWPQQAALGGVVHNAKFAKSLLQTAQGQQALHSVIETFLRRGGFDIQVNVVDADVLRDAQAQPEQYRDLVVRVAGYSDYFVHLSPTMQDEVITRTEHTL